MLNVRERSTYGRLGRSADARRCVYQSPARLRRPATATREHHRCSARAPVTHLAPARRRTPGFCGFSACSCHAARALLGVGCPPHMPPLRDGRLQRCNYYSPTGRHRAASTCFTLELDATRTAGPASGTLEVGRAKTDAARPHARSDWSPRSAAFTRTPTTSTSIPRSTACFFEASSRSTEVEPVSRLSAVRTPPCGTLPLRVKTTRIALCPRSAVGIERARAAASQSQLCPAADRHQRQP